MRKTLLRVCTSACTYLGLVVSLIGEVCAASPQTQTIELKEGINEIGLYVSPDNLNLDSILSGISEHVVYVKDEKGRMWREVNGKSINGIGEIVPTRGYIINVSKDVNLTVTGMPVAPTTPVKLSKGYNLFTFPGEAPLDPNIVFPDLAPDFIHLEDSARNKFFFDGGKWENEIISMTPGKMYLVKMASDSEDHDVAFCYRISTEAIGNGSITESGNVNAGSSYTVTITSDYRHKIGELYIDGSSITPQTTYTFDNLKEGHSVKAVFIADPVTIIPDTDDDGIKDNLEDMLGLDKNDASDVSDPRKLAFSFDKDGDGILDLYERIKGTDSDDAGDFPAGDFIVDPNRAEDPANKIYNTLGAAVAVAGDYDIISVAPGVYDEQIDVSEKSLFIMAQSKIERSIFKGLSLSDTTYGSVIDGFVFTDSRGMPESSLTDDLSLIVNCVWEENEGIIEQTNSSNEFRNCIFRGNFLENKLIDSDPVYTHCTFVNNAFADALFEYSWDTTVSSSKPVTLSNSIVYGNIMNGVGSDCTVSYSYVQGGAPGDGNIDVDAELEIPVNRFGFPLTDAPVINKGPVDSKVLYDHFDFAADGIRDIGAIEFIDSDNDGVCDAQERVEGTDVTDDQSFRDINFDGTPDALQLLPGNTASTVDSDLDGLTDSEETSMRSNPNSKDSDGDGLADGWEAFANLNYLDPTNANEDGDNDGLTDLQEYKLGTNPHAADTDRDAMPDGWEVKGTLNPAQNDAAKDKDTDSYTNLIEYIIDGTPQTPAADTPLNITIN